MQPVTKYVETRLEGRRSFVLLPDRLVMTCRGLSGEMDLAFELATLSPIVSRLHVRSRYFRLGFLLLMLPWFFAAMAAVAFQSATFTQLVVLPAGTSLVGLIMAAVSARRIEYARFTSQAGVAVVDIARAGAESAHFDAFVDALTKQIKVAQAAA
jgi:hypothetical protein